MKDVLNRSAGEASMPEMEGGQQKFAIAEEVYQGRAPSTIAIGHAPPITSSPHGPKAKEKGKLDAGQVKKGCRSQWKRVFGVPALKSLLMKILGSVVMKASGGWS